MSKNNYPLKKAEFTDWLEHLNAISERILLDKNLDVTINTILDTLNRYVKSIFLIYFTIDKDRKNLHFHSFSQKISPKIRGIEKFIPFDPYKIKYPLSSKGPLIIECVKKKKIMGSHHLRDFFYPVFQWKNLLNSIQKSLGINYCIAIPMQVHDEVKGVFFIATNQQEFSKLELELIKFYGNQLKMSIEHSQNLAELQKKYDSEKEMTMLLSHELKTPITITHHATQLLEMALKTREKNPEQIFSELLQYQEEIQQGLKRMDEICNTIFQLMESENNHPINFHKLDLKNQLQPLIKAMQRRCLEKKLNFEWKITEPDSTIYGGGAYLEEVLTILLDNAIKYTPKGWIKLKIKATTSTIKATVSDSGIGIPKSKQELVFERFYRNKSKKNENLSSIKGLGLGLYIAKKIIKKLGGSIKLEQNYFKKGTQFTLEVPVSTETKPQIMKN